MPIESVPSQPSLKALPTGASATGLFGSRQADRLAEILRTAGDRPGGYRSVYDLFEEMLDKDGHLYSVIQTRIYGLLSRERSVVAGGDDPRDVAVAEWVQRTLAAVPGWEEALRWLLMSLAKGMAVVEIDWGYRPPDPRREAVALSGPERQAVPFGLRRRLPQDFAIDDEGRLRVIGEQDALWWGRLGTTDRAPVVPLGKALMMTFNSAPDAPLGVGLCQKSFWLHWFKKQTLKFWVIFNEKFGQPTVVGKYPTGANPTDQEALLEVVESLQTDAGVTIPENMVIDLLEAKRSGTVNTYKDLVDWCNNEMSKVVLGETLTADEGRRTGSYALGQIHNLVRNEYIESDAKALMAVINEQLIRPMVRFNFGNDVALPRWVIDTTADENLREQLEVDRGLIAAGVPLSLDYFYQRYRRPAPSQGEATLRYDDRNVYQYHLELGILTINEVREILGLTPVPWGDERTQPRDKSSVASESEIATDDGDNPEPETELALEE